MVDHVPWPHIESFHSMRRSARKMGVDTTIGYQSKIKLHGTNAAVNLLGEVPVAQSRNGMIDGDHFGFRKWMLDNEGYWRSTPWRGVVFGEWCGPGIQRGVAISNIPSRMFAVFGIQMDEDTLLVEPETILNMLDAGCPGMRVIPWYHEVPLRIDLANPSDGVFEHINTHVSKIGAEDPWVKSEFGVSGPGEGLVFYPTLPGRKYFSDYAFKAKGESHRNVVAKKPVQASAEALAGVADFAAATVTEQRLNQAIAETGAERGDGLKIGAFLGWIGGDVKREAAAELEASGLKWKDVAGAVTNAAKAWYLRGAPA